MDPISARSPNAMIENPCPVGSCAEIISGKWTLLVIRDLADGSQRFCELERSLEGISPRTLSLRLRALEDHGIVERLPHPTSTPSGAPLPAAICSIPLARWPPAASISLKSCGLEATSKATSSVMLPAVTCLSRAWSKVCIP